MLARPSLLAALLRDQRVSVTDLTPSYLRLLDDDCLAGLRVLKRTVAIPSDWKVDAALLRAMVRLRLAELA